KSLTECMQTDSPQQFLNIFNFPDGSHGYFDLRMYPVEEGVLIFSIDMTPQKILEKNLQEINAELDEKVKLRTEELLLKNNELEQFAYIASHDLREHLLTIKNYSRLFFDEYMHDRVEEAPPYLYFIAGAVSRMEELINGILDYARLSRPRQLEITDCNETV